MTSIRVLKSLWVVILGVGLCSCATTYDDGTRALQASNYAAAEQLLVKAIKEGDNVAAAWNNLGVVYARTARPELAVKSYTMAARYGDANARKNLTELNKPVPLPDLIGARQPAVGGGSVSSGTSSSQAICNCKGYSGPGGPCYSGPGGLAYDGPGGPAYRGPGGACYAGPGGPEYRGPGGPAYAGPGGPRYDGPGGPAYKGPGGPAYDGPGGACYSGPGGPCYSGPGGTGKSCPAVCK